jgi:hypothetical protein
MCLTMPSIPRNCRRPKDFTAFALFMSCSPPRSPELGFPPLPPFPTGYLPGPLGSLPSLIFFHINGGERDAENQRLFALNLSGSGNPEYAIHRVVEPEIDHIES